MAQTGYSVLSIYNSSTPSAVPTAGNLVAGELAINTQDGKLFYKDAAGVVQVIAGKGGAGVAGGSNTQVQYNSSGSLAGSANMTFDGTNFQTVNILPVTSGTKTLGSTSLKWSSVYTSELADGTDQLIGTSGTTFRVGAGSSWTAQAFYIAGTERMRIDSSGNVGIGTSSPSTKLSVATEARVFSTTQAILSFGNAANTSYAKLEYDDTTGNFNLNNPRAYPLRFLTDNTERMRIDSSGKWMLGTTSALNSGGAIGSIVFAGGQGLFIATNGQGNGQVMGFNYNLTTNVGSINITSTTTTYSITSDYRLKTVVGSIIDSGKRIDALQPVEYDWNTGGRTRGFIAHQFAEVYPNSVSGEKDAVDEEGKPVYQNMQASTSEVMADLIAEIQSLRKRVAQLESK